nr:efflux RND transporter permease subunit [Adhaeribacter radiodurans]
MTLDPENLSIFSIIGMIMPMGLVAKNAILLVNLMNQLKAQGMAVREALIEAGRERLRPILMTTLAMVFGLLPIALAKGAGAETKNSLAWVIIGGLTSSLILTLVLVPSI